MLREVFYTLHSKLLAKLSDVYENGKFRPQVLFTVFFVIRVLKVFTEKALVLFLLQ